MKLFNKNFYKFLFSFVAVIATTLVLVLLVGIGAQQFHLEFFMIRVTDQYFWNVIFILFYVGLLVMAVIILDSEAHIPYTSLTLLDLTLITLASFRITRMFVYDSITRFLREQFYDVKMVRTKATLVKPTVGPRRTLADLITCPWCFGVWATTWVTFFYLLTPLAYFPTLILALASVATLLQLFANALGWKAEQLKRETEEQ